jgi:hypothetical protein
LLEVRTGVLVVDVQPGDAPVYVLRVLRPMGGGAEVSPEDFAAKFISYRRSGHLAIDDGHSEGPHLWTMDADLGMHIVDMARPALVRRMKSDAKRVRAETLRDFAALIVKKFRSAEAREVADWMRRQAR